MIEALVFDFDGLILDTEAPEFEAWQAIYAAHGVELPFEAWASCIGTVGAFNPYEDLEARLGRPLDLARITAEHGGDFARRLEAEALRPGIADYLVDGRRLGLRLGVASSSSRTWVEGHLARLGLREHFHAIRCGDEVERVKPEPHLYLAAVDALGVAPSRALAFEDSPNGVRAAKRAGLLCVAVPNPLTARLDLGEADLQLPSLAAVPLAALLVRLAAG